MYTVKAKYVGNTAKLQDNIKQQAVGIVIKQALGMATAAYQVYPVGKPHTDGTPHTRDTFQVLDGDKIIAESGKFSKAAGQYKAGQKIKIRFLAKGASFFVEFGTIYMEARPILRTLIKRAQRDIANELRKINVKLGKK